jgi:hypothetical protein
MTLSHFALSALMVVLALLPVVMISLAQNTEAQAEPEYDLR